MKAYNSSDLNNKRSEILEEAASNGVIIQEKKTNGKVRREFVLIPNERNWRIEGSVKDRPDENGSYPCT